MAERVVLLGTGSLAYKLAAGLRAHPEAHVLCGVISENPHLDPDLGCPHLGSLQDLQRILAEQKPDRVIVAMEEQHGHLGAERLVDIQAVGGPVVETGADAYERVTGKLAIEALTANAVLFSGRFRPSRVSLAFSRGFSLAVAVMGLALFAPIMALVALAIRLDSRGPILFVQERVGLGGKRFNLLKFRSMRQATQKHSEWAGDNEDRITRVGRVLRKFRLDELPQFINVLRGDMNVVGPRPHPDSNRRLFILVSRNTPECGEQIPYYSLRSSIRPGITGWAQVRYKYANGLDEEIEKLRYDLYYIKHYSVLLDMRILFETVKVVLLGHRRLEEGVAIPPAMDGGEETQAPSQPLLPGLATALHTRARPQAQAQAGRSLGGMQ